MRKRLLCLRIVIFVILTLGALESHAAEFFCPSGNVTCLIAAINQANQNFQQNTINLEAGTYRLNAVDNGDVFEGNGLPLITGKITIRGQGSSLTIIERDDAAPSFRIFRIEPTGVLVLEALAARGGELFGGTGGAIILNLGDLTINQSDISEGALLFGEIGGGVSNLANAKLRVRSSRIFDNIALDAFGGGGIFNEGTASIEDSFIFRNSASDSFIGRGGGIHNTGELTLSRTNLVNNHALASGGGLANFGKANLDRVFIWLNTNHASIPIGGGGGIYNNSNMELTIFSSTIAENGTELEGGAIFNERGRVTVTNSTIVGNRVEAIAFGITGAGGISNEDQLVIQNSIVALNSTPTGASDCSGSPVSLDYNIIGDISGCLIGLKQTDLLGDPGLGDLVVEDAPGRGYFPLLANSPAINSANPDACPATDQLGNPRLGICDRGSVEFQDGRMLVSIDIRPKKDANRINPGSSKVINVAIFSVNGFDATAIDSSTVRFGATGTEASPVHVVLNDVDGDGDRDMVLRFQIQDMGIQCGDTSAFLAGKISGGPSFIGSSPLTTVQCGKQSQLATSSKK